MRLPHSHYADFYISAVYIIRLGLSVVCARFGQFVKSVTIGNLIGQN